MPLRFPTRNSKTIIAVLMGSGIYLIIDKGNDVNDNKNAIVSAS